MAKKRKNRKHHSSPHDLANNIASSDVPLKRKKRKSYQRCLDRVNHDGVLSSNAVAKTEGIPKLSPKYPKHATHQKQSTQPNNQEQKCKLSLAKSLKKHRGVAADTPPPPIWKKNVDRLEENYTNSKNFLTPEDDKLAFGDCLRTSYAGFHYDEPSSLPDNLHREFSSSFLGMEQGGLFLYDTVQPGKRRLTRTSVTRTLVGDPGSTYKYLGLRLFSHPWVDVDEDGNAIHTSSRGDDGKSLKGNDVLAGSTLRKLGYSDETTAALISMGNVNSDLIERSKAKLEKHVAQHVKPRGLVGSADFNLTLVNKMEPTTVKRDLKKELIYGMGKISVGWHRDSGLKDFSTIAVYQTFQGSSSRNDGKSWGVALRAMDGGDGGPLNDIPALMMSLPSGSLYYMLDEFNHNHEHAVIAGNDGIRYSSTHRVAREGQGTWQYIRDKIHNFDSEWNLTNVDMAIPASYQPSRKVKELRAQQNLMSEIEFEWLRQWYIQGKKHASLHPYWEKPIAILCDYFCKLERSCLKVIHQLREASTSVTESSYVSEDLYDVLIELLQERSMLRKSWRERYKDSIFLSLDAEERPIPCPCLDRNDHGCKQQLVSESEELPENLDLLISKLRSWRSAFVSKKSTGINTETEKVNGNEKVKKSKKGIKSRPGSMTKNEQRRIASNWEVLRQGLSRKYPKNNYFR